MFNVGGGEIMVILLLALLVLGPDKLPEYTRKAGRYINEFRRMTSGFQEEFRSAIDLGDTLSPTPAKPAEPPAATIPDDALDRTTDGPRLQPQAPVPAETASPEPVVEAAAVEASPAPEPVAPASVTEPAPQEASAADVTPASGSGPELITPSRPPVDHHGDPGSSSEA